MTKNKCSPKCSFECLRLKIIERLLKEGSSAEEPINIQLSDYSSDEGSSSSSDNEGRGSNKEFSDLEARCCHLLSAPPCSPELDVEIRKFRYCRMRKVMQELDRIYFQPLFHKKCQFLVKAKRGTLKKRKRKLNKSAGIKRSIQNFVKSEISDLENPTQIQTANQDSNTVTLRYVNENNDKQLREVSSGTTVIEKRPSQTFGISKNSKMINRKRLRSGQEIINKKPLVKVSRKLRLWLTKRQIFIVRRKLPHKLKIRLKSLHRRKKEERLLLDMPTTDPGSDLLFSTDDECVDANNSVFRHGTMPRIRRNLLKSDLQRRYIEEIGDGLRHMPPELIITPPSNKGKQKYNNVRIVYKPSGDQYERKSPTANELPFIGVQPAKSTSSLHNLNTTSQSPTSTPYKQTVVTKNKSQSPFYRPLTKREPLSREDLDIKLSLKKKIWTGMQPDDNNLAVDRNRVLSWIAPATLKTNKIRLNGGQENAKKLENEALLTACSQKLMEWQLMNSNADSSICSQKTTMPLKLIAPNIAEDNTMCIFKHLANIKKPNTANSVANLDNDNIKNRPKRNTISKIAETSSIFTKASKSKTRNILATTQRSLAKQTGKTHARSNKFKTGGLVVTAVQTRAPGKDLGEAAKKNKKTKLIQIKLPNPDSSSANNINGGDNCRPSTQIPINSTSNKRGGLTMAATATTIARKVKTKLKKKKSSNTTQNTINFNTIYISNNTSTKS